MLNYFSLLAESGTDTTTQNNSWYIYIVLGVLAVLLVVMMIVPQRKQKKRTEEMMAKLQIGSVITTIGGIIGTVVQLDETHIWIETGLGENKATMQFLRQAIHSIAPAAGSPEQIAEERAEKRDGNENDEIL